MWHIANQDDARENLPGPEKYCEWKWGGVVGARGLGLGEDTWVEEHNHKPVSRCEKQMRHTKYTSCLRHLFFEIILSSLLIFDYDTKNVSQFIVISFIRETSRNREKLLFKIRPKNAHLLNTLINHCLLEDFQSEKHGHLINWFLVLSKWIYHR